LSNTPFEQAIVRRVCTHLGHEADPSAVDCQAPLFDRHGFQIAGYVLDSLSLAEMLVMLEGDLDVEILGCASVEDIRSLAAIAAYVADAAPPATIVTFERDWRS
jgi:hypothetical protein